MLQMQLQQLERPRRLNPVPPARGAHRPWRAPAMVRPTARRRQRRGRRSDVFDPNANPECAGRAARARRRARVVARRRRPAPIAADEPPIGAPDGRDAGAPLDLELARQ